MTRLELELSALGDRQIQSSVTWSQRCNFWNSLAHTLTRIQDECKVESGYSEIEEQTTRLQDKLNTGEIDKREWSTKKIIKDGNNKISISRQDSHVLQDLDVSPETKSPR